MTPRQTGNSIDQLQTSQTQTNNSPILIFMFDCVVISLPNQQIGNKVELLSHRTNFCVNFVPKLIEVWLVVLENDSRNLQHAKYPEGKNPKNFHKVIQQIYSEIDTVKSHGEIPKHAEEKVKRDAKEKTKEVTEHAEVQKDAEKKAAEHAEKKVEEDAEKKAQEDAKEEVEKESPREMTEKEKEEEKEQEKEKEMEIELKRIINLVNDGGHVPKVDLEMALRLLLKFLLNSYEPIVPLDLIKDGIGPIQEFLKKMKEKSLVHFHILSRVMDALVRVSKTLDAGLEEKIVLIFAYALIRTPHHVEDTPIHAKYSGLNNRRKDLVKSMMEHIKKEKLKIPAVMAAIEHKRKDRLKIAAVMLTIKHMEKENPKIPAVE